MPESPRNKALPRVFGNALFAPGAEGIEPPPKVLETPTVSLKKLDFTDFLTVVYLG